jgi:parallel beta-helix repeat protein
MTLASICSVAIDITAKASSQAIIVPNNYQTIQEAINNANAGDTIRVASGTYYEHVVVNKTLTLVGEKVNASLPDANGNGVVTTVDGDNTTSPVIDGNGTGVVVDISANNVTLSGFSITNGGSEWWPACNVLVQGNFTTVSENNIMDNACYGMIVDFSHGNSIVDNVIANNGVGVYLWHSTYDLLPENNFVSRNVLINNSDSGISLLLSRNNVVTGNTILHNGVGIAVSDSQANEISLNRIGNNSVGLRLENGGGSGSIIYSNNLVNNTKQAEIQLEYCRWDYDYPVCGNFWSDYNGTDMYSGPDQNMSGSDGIGDTPRIIDENNQDNYPLMGKFYSRNITSLPGMTITLISNSTVSFIDAITIMSLDPPTSVRVVAINITDESGFGFCRLSIPHAYMNISGTPAIIDNGRTPIFYSNYTLYDDGTCRWIYFVYNQSAPPDLPGDRFKIFVIPEFPPIVMLPLLVAATSAMIVRCRRSRKLGLVSQVEVLNVAP